MEWWDYMRKGGEWIDEKLTARSANGHRSLKALLPIVTRGGIDINDIRTAARDKSSVLTKEFHTKYRAPQSVQLAYFVAQAAHLVSTSTLRRVADLEARIAAMETDQVRGLRDAGFYRADKLYDVGDGVTQAGSFWIAQTSTSSKPEVGNPDWRLAVKKGRDGRDAR